MNIFYPFIYERKKKNIEPLPLYIEINPIPLEKLTEKEKENKEEIIIEL